MVGNEEEEEKEEGIDSPLPKTVRFPQSIASRHRVRKLTLCAK